MSVRESRTLQSIIDPFVKRVGGELVSDLIGNNSPEANADYFFREADVIVELKSLKAGGFTSSFHRKLSNLTGKWHRQGKVLAFETSLILSSKLPKDCQSELFHALAASFQKHVIYTANKQIKSTKTLLGRPNARGLLWVASDGNDDFQPDAVWYALWRSLQKKHAEGTPAYSGIDGLTYFNPRMPAIISGVAEPALFWFSRSRCFRADGSLEGLMTLLGNEWPRYVTWAQGVPVHSIQASPSDLRFPGGEKIPKIAPNYD